jgi:DNA-binding IclR family transcriptional regulator
MPNSMTSYVFLGFTKALLDYLRSSAEIVGLTNNLDLYSRTFLVMTAVFIGEHEDHPMIVSDVVNYTGIPRATVQREVERLEEEGLLRTEKRGRRKELMMGDGRYLKVHEAHKKLLKRFIDRVARLRSHT